MERVFGVSLSPYIGEEFFFLLNPFDFLKTAREVQVRDVI